MRTLVISDLHLGSGSRADLLRSEALRAPLLEAVGAADRVVLLGDTLELRHGPARMAMATARPFFEELGRSLGDGEVVICPGNHDYALIAGWLARRGEVERPEALGVEQRLEPGEASPALLTVAEWLRPARLSVAYPGLWLREDVYAMHGHYLDCHVTIPTLERLGIGAMSRVLSRPADSLCCVDDYETLTGPLFAWIDAVARQGPTGPAINGSVTVRAWHALGGEDSTHSALAGDGSRTIVRDTLASVAPVLRRRALMRVFPLVVSALNRAGMGPLKADISGPELRRAGLCAAGEVAARLGLGRSLRDLRAHPPRRAHARRRGVGVARSPGREAAEHRLLDLRARVPQIGLPRSPLLAGRVRGRGGLRPPAGRAPARRLLAGGTARGARAPSPPP